MAIDILDMAKGLLGSGAMGELAGLLGEGEKETSKAFDVASSSILAGLMKKASSPKGAEDLMHNLRQFDPSVLDNAGSIFTGQSDAEQQSNWTSMGWDLISKLLGDNLTSILEMISKVTGIGQGSSKSLLSMLAPMILGVITKQVKSGNLDLAGLVDLLMGQSKQVAKAIPADYQRQFGIADLLSEGVESARESGRQVTRAAQETASAGASWIKTLVPLLIIAGLAAVAWSLFSKPAEDLAATTTEAVEDAARSMSRPALPEISIDAISEPITNSFSKLQETLAGITDEASARAAVPQIEGLEKSFSNYAFDQLPEGQLSQLSGLLAPLVENIRTALESAYKIPGVQAILEPVVDSLMQKVTQYVRA